ncbi:PLP-dependent aminotransferase family protein [Halalkalibacter urbisdiaboli]|uniref:aminotransferase-like domain-containing protein n=1 Tax=Halalkalibacter urbisdiaboli TaxID=1960589 RepID=UPI001FD883B3|nr:PLP-dependent aminotransferase family protein [Halalkalibacter urbisdiaboli]
MGKIPRYLQIVQTIREKILRGEWSVGSKIPTQRELSEKFNVNRSTVITAIEILKSEGLLEGRIGSGVYIVNNKWSLLNAFSPPDWHDLSKWALHPPSDNTVQTINELETKKDIIQLCKGELGSDLFPHIEIAEAANRAFNKLPEFGYGDGYGDLELRKEMSIYLRKQGIHASPSNILIVSGALQAIKLISIGILKKGSTIFIENPSYIYSLNLFRSTGMNLKPISIDNDGLNIEELTQQKIINNLSALYVNPTYQNPTSTIMSLKKRKLLIETCQYYQLPIIEDDIYRDLWIDEPSPFPIKTFDKQGQVLYVGSFSKSIAAGLRIGWLVGPEDVVKRLSDLRMQIDYGSSYLPQVLVKELLSSGLYEDHLIRTRSFLKKKRDFLLTLLQTHLSEYATWTKPQGGFFIWVTFSKSINMRKLFKRSISKGVLINPGFIYNDNKSTIRLSFAYPNFEEMEKGILILKALIK